ncbi:MAG: hypothetical protein K2Q28_02385 [Hyphomicrobium sp.]|jgi:hypothetical protein|nr:hypothetical protein [Hyphomicrobium sp.]
MSGSADHKNDGAWWGRPQDDPALHDALNKRFADFRRAHPPVNCWIDKVGTAELYLGGVRRALVERRRALVMLYDEQGEPASSVVFLRSESAYDVAESHLGIARVPEVRDESDEADEILSAAPREREDRVAAEFSSRHASDVEAFHYLRSAVKLLRLAGSASGKSAPVVDLLLQAIGAEVQDQYEQAVRLIKEAIAVLDSPPTDPLFGDPAIADCRRALEATERHVAVQSKRPVRRGPEWKSGG